MSRGDFPQLDRFLRGVHRRLRLVQMIESVGRCIAIACVVALPLILLLAWRGQRATEIAAAVVALGALAGFGWSLTHAGTPLDAAMEADRQLGLADLLSSALLLCDCATDQWNAVVVAEADARCRGLSASSVLLRRLSARAWSGIVLTIGLALILSAWVGAPRETLAQTTNAGSTPAAVVRNDARPLLDPIDPSSRIPAAPHEGEDQFGPASQAQNDSAPTSIPSQETRTDKSGARGNGQGGTLARTSAEQPQTAPRQESTHGTSAVANGRSAGGDADATELSAGSGTGGGSVAKSSAGPAQPVPWTGADWPAAVESATQKIDTGQVPAPYRDLVGEYFRRQ